MMCPTTAAFTKIHLASLPLLSRYKALRHFLDHLLCPDVGVSNGSKLSHSFSSKSEYPRLLFKPQADSPNYVLQKWMRAMIYLGGKALCLPWMTLHSYLGQGGCLGYYPHFPCIYSTLIFLGENHPSLAFGTFISHALLYTGFEPASEVISGMNT